MINCTKIATYIFVTACQTSCTQSWVAFKSEIEAMFNVKVTNEDMVKIISEMLLNYGRAISDISLNEVENGYTCEKELAIDFTLFGDYCLGIEEEE